MACDGKTSIEYWSLFRTGSENRAQLNFNSTSDNLFRVFGTHKLFRILSPSLRNVPFTGLEWSFWFKDEGYDCEGKIEEDKENQLMSSESDNNETADTIEMT